MTTTGKKTCIMHLISSLKTGGSEKLLLDLLRFLPAAGMEYENIAVVMNDVIDEGLREEIVKICPQVYFLGRRQGSKNPLYLKKLLKIIKKHNIKLIHSHNRGSRMWSILCRGLSKGLKLVYTVHSVYCPSNKSGIENLLHRWFINCNIAISNSVMSSCKKAGLKKVILIYNGIDFSRYHTGKTSNKEYKGHCLLNVARLNPEVKGQDILLKALVICKKRGLLFKCIFAGGTLHNDKNTLPSLIRLAKDNDLQQEVVFAGNCNDIPVLLSQSDIFIMPSRTEGLGLAVLEAMAAGVPVIASNVEGLKEIIDDNWNGLLFENGDYEELAEKIVFACENPITMDRIAISAVKYVLRFDIHVMCSKYMQIYRELIV